MAARIDHVREDHRMAAEYVIFQDAAGIYGNVVLDFDVIADDNAGRHHHVLADVTVRADPRVLHDVGEVPDSGTCSDRAAILGVARFMYEIVLLTHADREKACNRPKAAPSRETPARAEIVRRGEKDWDRYPCGPELTAAVARHLWRLD